MKKKICSILIIIFSIFLTLCSLYIIKNNYQEKEYFGIVSIYETDYDLISTGEGYILLNKEDNYKLLDSNKKEIISFNDSKKIYYFRAFDNYIILYKSDDNYNDISIIYTKDGTLIKEIKSNISIIKDYVTNNYYFIGTDYNKSYVYDLEFNEIYTSNNYVDINILNNVIYPVLTDYADEDFNTINNRNNAYDMNGNKLFNFSNYINLDNYALIIGENNYVYNKKSKELKQYKNYEYKDKHIFKNNKDYFIIDYDENIYQENEIDYIKYQDGYKAVKCKDDGYILKDKNDKTIYDTCASSYNLNYIKDNIIIADYFANENYKQELQIGNKKYGKHDYIEVINNVIRVMDSEKTTFYDLEYNKISLPNECNQSMMSINDNYFMCNKFNSIILNNNHEVIAKYQDIVCDENAVCVLTNEKGVKSLYQNGIYLVDFNEYYDIRFEDNLYFLKSIYGNKIITLGKTNDETSLLNIKKTEKININVDEIISKYNLDNIKDTIYANKELFNKYAYIISNNQNIDGFTEYVYKLFPILVKYQNNLDIDYLLYNFKFLKINKVNKLNTNQAGVYIDYDKRIDILYKEDRVVYHELIHFIDYNAKYKKNYFVKCDNKYYLYDDIKNTNLKCDYSDITGETSFIVEGEAEVFMSLYFNDGNPVVYKEPVAIITALKYLYGEKEIDRIFFTNDEVGELYNLIVKETGLSSEEYKDLLRTFNGSTNIVDYDYSINEKIVNILVKIYEARYKKEYTEDFNFKTILYSILNSGYDTKYESILLNHEKELNNKIKQHISDISYIYPFVMINDQKFYISFNVYYPEYGIYKVYFNEFGVIVDKKFNKN